MVSNWARYATPDEAATPCSSCNANPAFLREFRFKGLDWTSVANQTQEMPLYVRPDCLFRLLLAASRVLGVWCVLVCCSVPKIDAEDDLRHFEIEEGDILARKRLFESVKLDPAKAEVFKAF